MGIKSSERYSWTDEGRDFISLFFSHSPQISLEKSWFMNQRHRKENWKTSFSASTEAYESFVPN